MLTRLSASIWMSNPGYLLRDGLQTVSIAKSDYAWDQDEVREYMDTEAFGNFSHG